MALQFCNRLSLLSSLLACTATFTCAAGRPDIGQRGPTFPIHFSADQSYDQGALAMRDRDKPFFFALKDRANRPVVPFTVDKGSDVSASLSPLLPPGTSGKAERSLKLSITAAQDADVKDKIFADVVPHWSDLFKVSNKPEARFFALDFMLDPSYPVSRYWVIHLQVIQCCSGHPPFAMHVKPSPYPSGPVVMQFSFRDDTLERLSGSHENTVREIAMDRGKWYHLAFELAPAPDDSPGQGTLAAWVDGGQSFCVHPFWAYNAGTAARLPGKVTDDLGIDVGIYRRRVPLQQTVYIDNVIYGDTAETVGLASNIGPCR